MKYIVILASLVVIACSKDEVIVNTDGGRPVVVNSFNLYQFSVDARNLTTSRTDTLDFSFDSLMVTFVVSQFEGGSGSIALLDSTGAVLWADSIIIARNITVEVNGRVPLRAVVQINRLTAMVSFTVIGHRTQSGFPVTSFPRTIGTEWEYAIFDSVRNRRDTAVVRIIGQTTLPNGISAYIWERRFTSGNDSQYVSILNGTVRVFESWEISTPFSSTKYVFPLFTGKRWRGTYAGDSSTVVAIEIVEVPAGSFVAAQIYQRVLAVNDYLFIHSWFVPAVGLVKVDRLRFGWGDERSSWRLIRYTH
jgi:hypothetical protein